jgi:hypothetical protein
MSRKQENNHNEEQIGKYKQGSGSKYHQEHANHVPDYGGNVVDPNANGFSNIDENSIQ